MIIKSDLNDAVRLAVELEAYNTAEINVRDGRGYLHQIMNDDELEKEESVANSDSTTKDVALWMQRMVKSWGTLTTEVAKLKTIGINEGNAYNKTRYTQSKRTNNNWYNYGIWKQHNRKINEDTKVRFLGHIVSDKGIFTGPNTNKDLKSCLFLQIDDEVYVYFPVKKLGCLQNWLVSGKVLSKFPTNIVTLHINLTVNIEKNLKLYMSTDLRKISNRH